MKKLLRLLFWHTPVLVVMGYTIAAFKVIKDFCEDIIHAFGEIPSRWRSSTHHRCPWCDAYVVYRQKPNDDCDFCHGKIDMSVWAYTRAWKKKAEKEQ